MYLANAIDSHHHAVRWFGTAVCFKCDESVKLEYVAAQ